MGIFAVQEEQADVENLIVNKKDGSEGERESESQWQRAGEWFEVSMSREEKERWKVLGEKKEQNAEAKCGCRFIQSMPGKRYEN